jgi:hypothetical protein
MSAPFITIAEAVQMTGKSRRTIQRLVEALVKKQSDLAMKEKTDRGYIWKVSEQAVRQAYGIVGTPVSAVSPVDQQPAPASPPLAHQPEKYLEVVGQRYAGMMTLHQEVKRVYEERLKEKEDRIAELARALAQAKKGFWGWLFGS